ncbi:MAG: heme ABC exporter ATP-binding protein CcmA [Beijerinckiaceae bacterium]
MADRLTCRRGEHLVFADLSFELTSGSGLALIGPNGVGKTSLLRILAGLLRPCSGILAWEPQNDVPLAEWSHFIGVRDGLKDSLTPAEHVAFWIGLGDSRRSPNPGAVLEAHGLAKLALTPAGWLSTGQRRRLTLARLTATSRPAWLLDEPLNGLDLEAQTTLRRLAAAHLAAGGLIVAASHQPLGWDGLATLDLGRISGAGV